MSLGKRIVDALNERGPLTSHDIASLLDANFSSVQTALRRLWKRSVIYRSARPVTFSFLDGDSWVRRTCYVYGVEAGPAEVKVLRWDPYRRRNVEVKVRVELVPYSEEYLRKFDYNLTSKVLRFFEEREVGATAREVAEALGLSVKRASYVLNRLWKKGLLVRKGKWNEKLGKEVPFGSIDRKTMLGWIYGLTLEQCDKRIELGVLDPRVQLIVNEVKKHNGEGRFCPLAYLKAALNVNERTFYWLVEQAKSLHRNLKVVSIGDYKFAYFEDVLTSEQVERQRQYWEKWVEEQHRKSKEIGHLWELYGQEVFNFAERAGDFRFKMAWWRQKKRSGGEWSFSITLSNRREVDRVLQLDFEPFGFQVYLVFEFKFRKGGVTLRDVDEFLDKLRTCKEFGYQDKDGSWKLKSNVIPVMVGFFNRDVALAAMRRGVIVIEGWQLFNYLARKGVKARFDSLIRLSERKGIPFEELLKNRLSKVFGDELVQIPAKNGFM